MQAARRLLGSALPSITMTRNPGLGVACSTRLCKNPQAFAGARTIAR